LLANLLAASTYPLEVVQADRWLDEHKKLKDDALKTEVDKQGWDDSVKALASTPSVLSMMSDKLDWTKDLGDAVLAQQPDVMDAIQRLRAFSSEVEPGSRQENASNQESRAPFRFHRNGKGSSVLNQKFGGLQIDSMIADSPDFGEDWRWVDALLRWGWMRWNAPS
jgi:hypothetical protein